MNIFYKRILMGLVAWACAVSAVGLEGKSSKQMNVLFIAVDDMRPELGCYGADFVKSPNMDRLASEGVLFNRAYCQWAVCMASRSSLLLGLRPDFIPDRGRLFRKNLPDVVTLPQYFKDNGYFTQSFGKIFHGSWNTAGSLGVGDSYQDPISWSLPRWTSSPQYYFTEENIKLAREIFATSKAEHLAIIKKEPGNLDQWKDHFVQGPATEAPDVSDSTLGDGKLTQALILRMRELKTSGEPFFLAAGYMKPHLPFIAPKRYWNLYNPMKLPTEFHGMPPKDAPEIALTNWAELRTYTDMPKRGALSEEQARRLRHGYAACISFVDAQIGMLLKELDRLGLRKNTIVVLWSDHGYKLGDYGMWCKHTNFELDTRVALIVSAPGLERNEKSDALVELVDLYPTIVELAGLPAPDDVHGTSFAEIVKNTKIPGDTTALSQYPRGSVMGYSMRTNRYRLTLWSKNQDRSEIVAVELYDHHIDPTESINIAANGANSDLVSRLTRQLNSEWNVSTTDFN